MPKWYVFEQSILKLFVFKRLKISDVVKLVEYKSVYGYF